MDLSVTLVLNDIEIKTQAKLTLNSDYNYIPKDLLNIEGELKLKCKVDISKPVETENLYLIHCINSNKYKIGCSQNPYQTLSTLQDTYPFDLKLEACCPKDPLFPYTKYKDKETRGWLSLDTQDIKSIKLDFIKNTIFHNNHHFNKIQTTIKDPTIQNTVKDVSVQNIVKDLPVQNTVKDVPVQNTVKDVPVQNTVKDVSVQNTVKDLPVQNTVQIQNTVKDPPLQNTVQIQNDNVQNIPVAYPIVINNHENKIMDAMKDSRFILQKEIPYLSCVKVLLDGSIITCISDNTQSDKIFSPYKIRVFPPKNEKYIDLVSETSPIICLEILYDHLIVSGSKDGDIRISDYKTNKEIPFGCHKDLQSISISPDNKIITTSPSETRVWTFRRCKYMREKFESRLTFRNKNIIDTFVYGRILTDSLIDIQFVIKERNTIIIEDAFSGNELYLNGHTANIETYSILSDGINPDKIITGSKDGTIKIWNKTTGECETTFAGNTSGITCVIVLSGRIICGTNNGKIRVWNLKSGICENIFTGHLMKITCLTKFYDNKFISGSEDTHIRIWDLDTNSCQTIVNGHTSSIKTINSLPDRKFISSSNSEIIIW